MATVVIVPHSSGGGSHYGSSSSHGGSYGEGGHERGGNGGGDHERPQGDSRRPRDFEHAPFPVNEEVISREGAVSFGTTFEDLFAEHTPTYHGFDFASANPSEHTGGRYTIRNYLTNPSPSPLGVTLDAETSDKTREAMAVKLLKVPFDGSERKISIWYIPSMNSKPDQGIRIILRKVNNEWVTEGAYRETWTDPKVPASDEQIRTAFERTQAFLNTAYANKATIEAAAKA